MMGDSAMPTIASQRAGSSGAPDEREQGIAVGQELDGEQAPPDSPVEDARPPGEERRDRPRTPKRGGDTGLYPPRNPGRSTRMIGEVAVDLGFADRETVEEAVAAARAQGRPTGLVLVERGILRHDQLARVVAERFGLDFVDLSVYDLDMGAVNLISADTAKRYQAVPVGYTEDGALLLAMANPTNVLTIDDIGMMTGRRIRPAAASVEDLNLLLARLDEHGRVDRRHRRRGSRGRRGLGLLLVDEADSDAPIIKLVHSIVAQAIQQGASDIHVNPEEGDTRVLFRVDGVLTPAATVKRKMAAGVVSRIKIMAELDISERRVPQDGRFALTVDGRRVDIRVVTLPLVYGEGAVLRILDKSVVVDDLESLGMQDAELARFRAAIQRPNGAVLVTGPTGSGKSTTLYAALHVRQRRRALDPHDRGPRRAAHPGRQADADRPQGGRHLRRRAALDAAGRPRRDHGRRDPRPRDRPHRGRGRADRPPRALDAAHPRRAQRARAADRHGHRALPRLLGRRLHRRPAPRAHALPALQAPQSVSESVLVEHGLSGAEPYEPVGCSRCSGSGYRGRVGLYEVMTVSERIRTMILEHASVDDMVAVAARRRHAASARRRPAEGPRGPRPRSPRSNA